jgi:hypothetical protein
VSIVPLRKLTVGEETVELLRELLLEVRALRGDLRRDRQRVPAAVPALLGAIEEVFGSEARFTVRGVLQACDEEPHGKLAETVALVIDMNASARARATSLGALLVRTREVEVVSAGPPAIYRLRT